MKKKKLSIKRTIEKKMALQKQPVNKILSKNQMNERDALRVFGTKNKEEAKNQILNRTAPKPITINEHNLGYERNKINKIGVLIVNYNNLGYTKDCVSDLFKQINKNFKIWVVDQNSKEDGTEEFLKEIESIGVTVVRNSENVDLNKVWNWFYDTCDFEYLCFLNNDVRLTNNFIDDTITILDTEEKVGSVVHVTNNLDYVKCNHKLNYEIMSPPLYQGWDFTLRRELFEKIPDTLRIFGGDDLLFGYIVKKGFDVAIAYSSPVIHYKEKTREFFGKEIKEIQNEDAKHYWIEISKNSLPHINSTYNTHRSNKYAPNMMCLTQNKKCIFTASIGLYDDLSDTKFKKQDDWDYICFTDNLKLKSDFWKIEYIENTGSTVLDNYKQARKIKTSFYEYLSSYEYLVWRDCRIIMKCNLNDYLSKLGNNDMCLTKHNDAKSIMEEFNRILSGNLETQEMVDKIKERYKTFNYNYDNGLISSGVMLFRNNEKTIKFFKEWCNEIINYSHRDQLSANFVLSNNKDLQYRLLPYEDVLGYNGFFGLGKRKTKRLTFNE
jgi:GT2 family glycosyltransferase